MDLRSPIAVLRSYWLLWRAWMHASTADLDFAALELLSQRRSLVTSEMAIVMPTLAPVIVTFMLRFVGRSK